MGEKVIQIEVRKGWGTGQCLVVLWGWAVWQGGHSSQMRHGADGKVVAEPFPGSLGRLFPCKALGCSRHWWCAEPQPCPSHPKGIARAQLMEHTSSTR